MAFYAVIIAGGIGKRFWPRSRRSLPKQLLDITGDGTMLWLTLERLQRSTPVERILIVTNGEQRELILEKFPQFPAENILVEPEGKNTAPAVGLAAIHIQREDPEAVMGVFPADHLIRNTEAFQAALEKGIQVADERQALVTFGIVPTRPATGYGYIQYANHNGMGNGAYPVRTFAEKPDLETARLFLKSGDFLWNSGMFVWRVDVFLEAVQAFLPELYDSLMIIRKALGHNAYESVLTYEWATLRSISLDYGIMEKATNVYVIRAEFDWSDVGSWDAVYEVLSPDGTGNVFQGDVVALDSDENLVYSPHQLVALIGVDNLVVINTPDALLIVPRHTTERVKEMVELLERQERTEVL